MDFMLSPDAITKSLFGENCPRICPEISEETKNELMKSYRTGNPLKKTDKVKYRLLIQEDGHLLIRLNPHRTLVGRGVKRNFVFDRVTNRVYYL